MRLGLGMAIGFLLAACSSHAPSAAQAETAATPHVLIVGLARNPNYRVRFEDALATQLTRGGFIASTSYDELNEVSSIDAASLRALASRRDATLVAVIRPVDADGPASDALSASNRARYFETFVNAAIAEMPQLHANDHIMLSTHVYHLPSNQLIWGGMSWTFQVNNIDRLIRDASTLIARNMIAAYQQVQSMRANGVDVLAGD